MTIRPGSEWGESVVLPPEALDVADDAALAAAIERRDARPLRVRAGDLHRSVGSRPTSQTALRVTIDVLCALVNGVEMTAVAHIVARAPGCLGWWRGRIVAVMNVDHRDRWDVAPRAHPNDGRFDLVDVSAAMGVRARWQALRRLTTGTHVPHPLIATRRGRAETFTFDRPTQVWVDGVARGSVRSLAVRVVPDAAVVYV